MAKNQNKLTNLVCQLAIALEKEKTIYAISGAIANAAWGVPRATTDVDILVSLQGTITKID